MTTAIPVALWTDNIVVQVTAYDYGDGQPPQIQGTMQLDGGFAQLGFPAIKGDTGSAGAPGIPGVYQGAVTTASNLPSGLNATSDLAKFWYVSDTYVFAFWTGVTFKNTGSVRGQPGPASAIIAASDWDSTIAPVAGATIRYGTNNKWYAQKPMSQAFERTSDMTGTPVATSTGSTPGTIPSDTLCAIPFQSTDLPTSGPLSWSSSNNPSRIGITASGFLEGTATVRWANNQYNSRAAHLRINGTTLWSGSQMSSAPRGNSPSSAVGTTVQASFDRIPVSNGDYLELMVYQDSNGNLDAVAANHGIRLVLRLSPA